MNHKEHVLKYTNLVRINKIKCIEYLGSKCKVCGYGKCSAALDFHHRDPTQKQFSIGMKLRNDAKRLNFLVSDISDELDKCDLLCSNCHMELHYGKA